MRKTGTYRGLLVEAVPNSRGGMQLFTRDRRAPQEGFDPFGFERPELQEWIKIVTPDDPEFLVART